MHCHDMFAMMSCVSASSEMLVGNSGSFELRCQALHGELANLRSELKDLEQHEAVRWGCCIFSCCGFGLL